MAGAAVSDYRRAANEFSRGSKPRGFSLVWRDVYEYGAVQPVEEADHFYSTLFYEHQIELYESIIDFLNNDCGNISKSLQASN